MHTPVSNGKTYKDLIFQEIVDVFGETEFVKDKKGKEQKAFKYNLRPDTKMVRHLVRQVVAQGAFDMNYKDLPDDHRDRLK